MILPPEFYFHDPVHVAQRLLGQVLVHETREGTVRARIVEVEAYLGARDAASHAYRGQTARNATMFGPGGHVYVYLSYGMHFCMNAVTGPAGEAGAVLLRALEPLEGLALMQQRRRHQQDPRQLCNGPGKLTQALGITRALDGLALTRPPLFIEAGETIPPERIVTTTRIGITQAAESLLRFYIRDSPFVSRK